MDPEQDLLPQLLPPDEDRAELTYELLTVFASYFGSAETGGEPREVRYPMKTHRESLRAVFDKHGMLNSVYAGPALTDVQFEALRRRIREEVVGGTTLAVCRHVFFSSHCIQGCWRYRDKFQLLPVPPEAPRLSRPDGDHPFLFECRYRQGSGFVDLARRNREAWRLHALLNVLTGMRISWPGSRRAGAKHAWVQLSAETDDDKPQTTIRTAYCQRRYEYPGLRFVDDNFTPVDGVPALAAVAFDDPGSEIRRNVGEPAVIPPDLTASFDRFYALPPNKRADFLQACYWFSRIGDLGSYSLSFLCAIQAIEVLVPEAPPGIRCQHCKLERKSGPTALFAGFLDKYAPAREETANGRDQLYQVRSGLSHGYASLFLIDQEIGFGLNPRELAQQELFGEAITVARTALHGWLHSPEADSMISDKSQHQNSSSQSNAAAGVACTIAASPPFAFGLNPRELAQLKENDHGGGNDSGRSDADPVTLDRTNLSLAQFHSTEAEALLLKYRYVETLIGEKTHHASEGTFCEDLVREFLRKVLPRRYSVDTGFIRGRPMKIGGETRFVSHQLDVIVHDTVDYSPIFRSDNFVVVLPEAVAAVIEVKKRLTSSDLEGSLNNLAVARYLTHHCQPPHPSTDPGEGCRRVFTAVFAFTSDEQLKPATKIFSDTYPNRLTEIGRRIAPMFSVPDMIIVVDREILHRGTTDDLHTPFAVEHRSACVDNVNVAGQAFLCGLMVEMRVKEVSGGTWFRYSFPHGCVFTRVMSFYTPTDLLPPENAP